MRGLPTGQYIPDTSLVHRLDARVKLTGFLLLLIAAVMASNVLSYAMMLSVTIALIALARLSVRTALGSFGRMGWFFAIIFLMNALFFDAQEVLWSWWIFRLSVEGLKQGANVLLHMALVVVLSNVLTCTTPPMALTGALESLMRPLKLVRVPVEDVAMILSVAIQFIPTLLTETDMIKKAQTARGARFESRKLSEKAVAVLPMVVPIFLSAFRRADELSMAMEARGYRDAASRTKRKKAPLCLPDYAAFAACGAALAVQILLV